MNDSEFIECDNEKEVEAPKTGGKIKHTVESMLRQMETSREEIEYRTKNFDNVDVINKEEYIKYLKCTKCNLNFKKSINLGKTVGVHPLLGVLMCSSCCDYYGDGNFSLDSEGEDKYCRWCGEGGTIFACSKCICGFCDLCIKKHFGEDGLKAVKNDDDWACYFCNPKPLWCLRSICTLAKEAAQKKKECVEKNKMCGGLKKKKRKKKEVKNISGDTSSDSNSRNISSSKKMKQEKVLKLKEKVDKDESSSGESVSKNDSSVILRRKLRKNKNRWLDKNMTEELSESIKNNCNKNTKIQINLDKNDTSKFEADIKVNLEKLISIWKLIQTIAEVGLNSSCKRLKLLSKTDNFKTEEILQKEYEKLKSCMNVLMSSLSTAYDSVNCINEDINNENAKDEREILQSQETKFKKFATKFRMESNEASDPSSDGDSSSEDEDWNKLMLKKRGKKKSATRKFESTAETVKKDKCERGDSSNKKRENKKKISTSLFSDPGSDVEDKSNSEENKKARDKEEGNSNLNKGSVSGGPFIKVKSFARMLDANFFDKVTKSENPIVINLSDNDTDGSANKKPKEEEPIKGPEAVVPFAERPHKEDCSEQSNCLYEKESRVSDNITSEKNALSSDKKNWYENLSERAEEKEKNVDDNEGKSCLNSNDNESKGISNTDEEKKSFNKTEEKKKEESSDKNETKTKKILSKKKKGENSNYSSEDKKEKIESSENKNSPEGENESGKESPNVGDERIKIKKRLSFKDVESENKKNNESEQSQEENKHSSSDMDSVKRKNKKVLSKNSESGDEKNSSDSENERNKKASSDETTENRCKLSDEKQKRTKKLRKKKEKNTLKASFKIFRRKREKFLRSTLLKKNSERKNSSEEEIRLARILDSSDSESEEKKNGRRGERQKRKRILESSEEENHEKAAKKSDEDESEEDSQSQMSHSEDVKLSPSKYSKDDEKSIYEREKKRKKKEESSDTESSGEKKTKRSRKKRKRSSSTSDGDEKKKTKGRKNIKRILKKDSLQVETQVALKNEEERKKRINEKQKLLKELFPQQEETPEEIILDFDAKTKEPLIKIHKKLAKKLKPHQVKGVKFMWDCCFESIDKLEEDGGSGCILAHCMGLGKTLQVITLVHTVMTHNLGMNTVLIICPLSTVSNWIREFEVWLKNVHTDPITLYDLLKYKKMEERQFYLNEWHKNGGVLVLSYDLFRTLIGRSTKKKNSSKESTAKMLEKTLLDPGPDLVVCDEGHLLKNENTTLSKSVSKIKTSRRIILTGTPLQNNLSEYHCMIQFVKPNILGTKKEFFNRFVNPIKNGQFEDSTELDVKIMKRRSHVLHSMLDGCIQRFDYSVLTPFLPEKYEYVLSISLTEAQIKAYQHFISNISAKSLGSSKATSLFYDYQCLQRIWTHPRTMLMQSEKAERKEFSDRNSDDSLKDFVVSDDEDTTSFEKEDSDVSLQEVTSKKRVLRSAANDPNVVDEVEVDKHWWDKFYGRNAYDDLRESNKLVILFTLLKYCREINDKVLVFSQSLYSLDLIEYFLGKINDNNKKDNEELCGHRDTWVLGTDYFRLDGSTSSHTRILWCKYFNEESNTRTRLFLISTKAGGLGINLYGANRVIIFDASWNPSHDLQSIFRVYRFGQKKPCYIYRFLSEATMEEKIYERQVTKLSLAHRVVDEHQIERHYTMGNLQELYAFDPIPKDQKKVPKLPKDSVLADILTIHKDIIAGYHEHDSLLENKQEEELTEEERKAAWKDYEEEKAQKSALDLASQKQIMSMLQAHHEGTEGRVLNPVCFPQFYAEQNITAPRFFQPNIPLDIIQRGLQLGLTPLHNDTSESFFLKVLQREMSK